VGGRLVAVDGRADSWLETVHAGLQCEGVVVVDHVIDDALLVRVRDAMYRVHEEIKADVGSERLERAGELGVLRLMLRYDPVFYRLLELPHVLSVVDATLSETAVLHLQNGLVLSPLAGDAPDVFQLRFHRDFPRILNGYPMSVNTFLAIDEFTPENGGTTFVPGTQQVESTPSATYVRSAAVQAECPAGSMIVFDSTILHAAGENRSSKDRLAINQQFTRSYLKQQIDYVRALGEETVLAQAPRTQQLLGWYTRVVTSLDEYYRPSDERFYRAGQG
jgi:ectoine hydroxylase-related dioxygenase (phytanoyl-CoA dioxygenase family)